MTCAPPLILASASPRRRDLLARLGIEFHVEPSHVEEHMPESDIEPARYALDLARAKAIDVASRRRESIVLAADTVVALDGRILGKPETGDEARQMLASLRNREHQVVTAVAVARGADIVAVSVLSSVRMRSYRDDEIDAYVASGDPFDKAGAYAIQNQQFRPVATLDGCYCNVVGLPLIEAHGLLERFGVAMRDLDVATLPSKCRHCPLRRS